MSTQTVILVAIAISLMIVAAVYGFGSTVMNVGDETINNLSERADSGKGEIDFISNTPSQKFRFNGIEKEKIYL